MIIGMKKITVIALAEDAENTVAQLQSLGALHLIQTRTTETTGGAQSHAVREGLSRLNRVIRFLSDRAVSDGKQQEERIPAREAMARVEMINEKLDLLDKMDDEREKLLRNIEDVTPFGRFDPKRIQRLERRGLFVQLYAAPPELLKGLPEDLAIHKVHQSGSLHYFVTVTREPDNQLLPAYRVSPPDASLSDLQAKRAEYDQRYDEIVAEIASHHTILHALHSARLTLEDELALRETEEGLGVHGSLVWLEGYCPEPRLRELHQSAARSGWGILEREPAPDDRVPTLIENPRWLKPVEAVFDFIDTFPGYHEKDIGAPFYLFLTLFYGILIGDAGYGVLFLSALLFSRKVFKVRLAPLVTRLIVVFNLAAVGWGVLTANYFGMTLPDGSFLAKIALIDGDNIELMMKICFTIGLVHLTLAHLWTFISVINSLKAVAEVGWLMTLWAAYFLAMFVIAGVEFPMVMAYVGGVGIILALIFSGSLLSVAGIFQFPFAVINCFSDIASYLRLFAVGAAALALAQVFNGMAGDLIAGGGVLGILGGLLILLLGHSLNLVLGLLSVLVHGLRLNLLEFSGHIGLEWAGFKYNPFKMNRFSNDQLQ